MPVKGKFYPIRNREVEALENSVNRCLQYCNAVETAEEEQTPYPVMSPVETYYLCQNVLFLYSKLIDANYVRRPLDPAFNLESIH